MIGLQANQNPASRRFAELMAVDAIGRPLTARVVSITSKFGPAFAAAYDYFNKAGQGQPPHDGRRPYARYGRGAVKSNR